METYMKSGDLLWMASFQKKCAFQGKQKSYSTNLKGEIGISKNSSIIFTLRNEVNWVGALNLSNWVGEAGRCPNSRSPQSTTKQVQNKFLPGLYSETLSQEFLQNKTKSRKQRGGIERKERTQ